MSSQPIVSVLERAIVRAAAHVMHAGTPGTSQNLLLALPKASSRAIIIAKRVAHATELDGTNGLTGSGVF